MSNNKHIDEREFVSLMTANQRRICAYILTLVPNMNDAEDILQETTVFMWERRNDFESGTDFAAWGVRIAYFKVHEHRRKMRKKHSIVIADDQLDQFSTKALEEITEVDEQIERMKTCVKQMSPSDRQLLHMRYSLSVPVKQIASRINQSVRAIYYNISRIHGLLLDCIEGQQR